MVIYYKLCSRIENNGEMQMENKYHTLAEMAEKKMIDVDYSDDDIAIIDNVNDLTEVHSTRLNNNFIAVIKQGKAQMKVNGDVVTIGENQLFLCPPNTSLSDFMFSPGLEFRAMLVTDRLISAFLRDKKSIWNDTLYIYKKQVITINEHGTEFLGNVFKALQILTDDKDESTLTFRSESIRGLIYAVILGLCGILSLKLPDKKETSNVQGDSIFQRFLTLLNENKVKGNSVEDYAAQLYISPKYLSTVCRKATGKTAKAWIKEHTIEEIRYYLKETDLNIKQIVDKTGFVNASFFCKFVKQNFGMTPMQFRKR